MIANCMIQKGDYLLQTRRNADPEMRNTCANTDLVYKVTRVNAKTFGLECVAGYMKGTGCRLSKSFAQHSVDMWGTVTTWEKINYDGLGSGNS